MLLTWSSRTRKLTYTSAKTNVYPSHDENECLSITRRKHAFQCSQPRHTGRRAHTAIASASLQTIILLRFIENSAEIPLAAAAAAEAIISLTLRERLTERNSLSARETSPRACVEPKQDERESKERDAKREKERERESEVSDEEWMLV